MQSGSQRVLKLNSHTGDGKNRYRPTRPSCGRRGSPDVREACDTVQRPRHRFAGVPDLGLEVLGVIGVDPLVRRVVANRGCVVPRCVGSDVVQDASKAVGVLLVTVTCDVRCRYLEHLGNTHVRPRVGPFDDDCLEVRRELDSRSAANLRLHLSQRVLQRGHVPFSWPISSALKLCPPGARGIRC